MGILTSLLVLIGIMGLGAASRLADILDRDVKKSFASFLYHFALPALFIRNLSTLDFSSLDPRILIAFTLPVVLILSLLLVLRAVHVISKDIFIILAVIGVFGSNTFFGIPFYETLFGKEGLSFFILPAAVLGTIGIVTVSILFEYATTSHSLDFLRNLVKNPLIISIIAGTLLSLSGFNPDFLNAGLDLLAQTTGGLAIFLMGMFIHDNFSLSLLKKALAFALFRIVALPLMTLLILVITGEWSGQTGTFLFLLSGIPAATSIAVFSERYEYRQTELTGAVVITSILSFPVLIGLYFLSGALFPLNP